MTVLTEPTPALAAAIAERLPPARREPVLAIVGRIQSELGVRLPRPLETYGPTSHCSEAALFFAYRNADPSREIG